MAREPFYQFTLCPIRCSKKSALKTTLTSFSDSMFIAINRYPFFWNSLQLPYFQFNAKFTPAEFPLMRHFKERVYLGVETITKLDFQERLKSWLNFTLQNYTNSVLKQHQPQKVHFHTSLLGYPWCRSSPVRRPYSHEQRFGYSEINDQVNWSISTNFLMKITRNLLMPIRDFRNLGPKNELWVEVLSHLKFLLWAAVALIAATGGLAGTLKQ